MNQIARNVVECPECKGVVPATGCELCGCLGYIPAPKKDIATGLANEAILLEAMKHIWEVSISEDKDALQHIYSIASLALMSLTPCQMQVTPFALPRSKPRFYGMDWSDVQELRGEI